VLDIKDLSILGVDFHQGFPIALIEVEKDVPAALSDLENYVEGDGRSSPVIIVTESQKTVRRKDIEGEHKFRIRSLPHYEID
jgi:hypothetical protein